LDAHELRETFLSFFEERDHRRVPGAPLVPSGDPTLMFTGAGMVQFKPYFMGQAKPPHTRLASVQKCFRTTDIDSVGDGAHLTFFEMLGNFSIGDYFKPEIIPWAHEFLTTRLRLTQDRLWPAVYEDDDEAFDLWRGLGYPPERIMRYGEDDNYWFSGDIGPCGPDSEVHYDFGEQFGCGSECHPAHGHDRFVEIWNLVFMSFYCDGDKRTPLPSNNVDTGSGLERVRTVLLFESEGWDKERLPSVYDTDLFQPIIRKIEQLSGKRYGQDAETDRAIRIVAEHMRSVTFLIGDERTPVTPSNEERGYVVRRMLRRAIYFARHPLGIEGAFAGSIADTVIDTMSVSYPELARQRNFIQDILQPEERRFDETLHRGLDLLEEVIARSAGGTLSGRDAFTLHDTYGFPIELTREIAAAHGLTVDEATFGSEMEVQRVRARAGSGGADAVAADTFYAALSSAATPFLGYETLESTARTLALVTTTGGLSSIQAAAAGAQVEVLLSQTPFYPEGGGQVGDRGSIGAPHGRIEVQDTQRIAERLIVHRGRVTEGRVATGDDVTAAVDPEHRADTMRNHTATHLLHAALREVLGTHVRQKGSLVSPDYLRFDFTHTQAITQDQLAALESLVNQKVRQNLPVTTRMSTFDEAINDGVLAFFGDKYGAEVRVVEVNSVVPRFSAELCGGTHCHHTGEVGAVIITAESSIGSGMRRIEALTGRGAESYVRSIREEITGMARRLGVRRDSVGARVESLVGEVDSQRKKIEKLERSIASAPAGDSILDAAVQVDGVRVIATKVDAPSIDALRYFADAARRDLDSGVAVLASEVDGRPQFVSIVSQDLIAQGVHAGNLLKQVASVAGGGGGGRPDMAQGGGKDTSKIAEALAIVPDAVKEMLSGGNA
jgi:alanyl-tRNA synthetase